MKYDFAIQCEEMKGDVKHLFVDTNKAHMMRMKWTELGDWGKKKFENMLFLTCMEGGKVKLKIRYVTTN